MNFTTKLRRLLIWIKLLWNMKNNSLGLYSVMSQELKFIAEDLDLNEFQLEKIKDASKKLDKIINNPTHFNNQSNLASVTECIRKYSSTWK